MQESQQQAKKSFALKDAYVGGVKNEIKAGRLIPGIAQQPAVLQASGHVFLDEGKGGMINDGDPSLYIHKGVETQRYDAPQYKNPLPGGPGQRKLEGGYPEDELNNLRQKFDERQYQLEQQKYGTGNMAQFQDPMTVKRIIG